MTVEDLIEKLREMSPTALVIVINEDGGDRINRGDVVDVRYEGGIVELVCD